MQRNVLTSAQITHTYTHRERHGQLSLMGWMMNGRFRVRPRVGGVRCVGLRGNGSSCLAAPPLGGGVEVVTYRARRGPRETSAKISCCSVGGLDHALA